MRTWLARVAREWPWAIAVCAILSLPFIPRVVSFGGPALAAQRQELDGLRRELDAGDATAAEADLASFLSAYPRSPFRAEAGLLLARATLGRGRAGLYPGDRELARAWTILSKASGTPEVLELRREVAAQSEEYGLVREAVERYARLYSEDRNPDLALDLAGALIRRAAAEPDLRIPLLDDASARVSDALLVLPASRRVRALLVKAQVLRENGRDKDLIAQLSDDLAETRNPADRGLLQLERGRAFDRLGRNMEALAALDEAEHLLQDPLLRGMAQVRQAELLLKAGNAEGAELCKRVRTSDSPAAPFARIVLGLSELGSTPSAGLDDVLGGLSQIRRPRLADEAGVDLTAMSAPLRAAAERETDPDRLRKLAVIYGELSRLRPNSRKIGFAHAALLLRAGRYAEAADRYLATGKSERADAEDRDRAVRSAAEASAEGGLYRRAAALYREYYDLRPSANLAGIFHRAASLRKAGDPEGAKAGFEDYVSKAGPSGSLTGAALLEVGSIHETAESWAAALAAYDRVLQAREVLTSPEKDDWAQALLGRGRVLLRLSRPAEAKAVLDEYLERYAGGPAPAPASLEAAWLLMRTAVDRRDWTEGLDRLRTMEDVASRLSEADRAPFLGRLREARFVEGDLLFARGDYAAAARAYGDAVRRSADPDDRLRGYVGRARALARLERIDEARRDVASARSLLDEGRAAATGPAREFWDGALEALAREVQ